MPVSVHLAVLQVIPTACRWGGSGRLAGIVLCLALLTLAADPLAARETNDVNEETVKKKEKVFAFEGGNPIEFIAALDRHFRTRLVQILTLPEILSKTKVPKLRVAAEDPREVLNVYNRLQSPTLGQWHYEPEGTNQSPATATATNTPAPSMHALMLVPDKTVVASKMERSAIRVKGVALAGVPDTKWDGLLQDIDAARAYGERVSTNGMAEALDGSVRFQRESKVLIVAGSEAYIQMVDSLVTAHRLNAELETKAAAVNSKSTEVNGAGK